MENVKQNVYTFSDLYYWIKLKRYLYLNMIDNFLRNSLL